MGESLAGEEGRSEKGAVPKFKWVTPFKVRANQVQSESRQNRGKKHIHPKSRQMGEPDGKSSRREVKVAGVCLGALRRRASGAGGGGGGGGGE